MSAPIPARVVLCRWLDLRLSPGKQFYVKSRVIAEELGMSAKMVGALLEGLSRVPVDGVRVEAWARGRSMTWRVWREP